MNRLTNERWNGVWLQCCNVWAPQLRGSAHKFLPKFKTTKMLIVELSSASIHFNLPCDRCSHRIHQFVHVPINLASIRFSHLEITSFEIDSSKTWNNKADMICGKEVFCFRREKWLHIYYYHYFGCSRRYMRSSYKYCGTKKKLEGERKKKKKKKKKTNHDRDSCDEWIRCNAHYITWNARASEKIVQNG